MPNAIFVKKELFPQILDIEQIVQAALALQDAENNAGVRRPKNRLSLN